LQPGTDKAATTGPTARQDPSLPQVFGRYLLVQRLSRGGMGEIFLAKHGLAGFEKLAVIKKVLPHLAADASFISRFVDEAQVAIKLQHVNVAQVFEVGRVGDEYFLALEYVEGRDLRRTLALLNQRRIRMPVDLALFIGRELANGLAYAHRRTGADGASLHLVHCDISPPNVLVSFEGETKVIDFGIAKSALRGTATDPKMGFGKFGYMAPEQLIRGGIVDHRTDIYAAGVVLYELLTGQRLYEAGAEPDYRALARKVAKGEHPVPSQCDPVLAPYDNLVSIALRPKVEDRYQTAAELRDAIQQCLVAVNPTISTDQLGTYMRELFAEEMNAQRELHERVAKAHLEDFKEEFHTQNISTVSFAFAVGDAAAAAAAPAAAAAAAAPAPAPRPRTPTGAASVVVTPDLSLADGTGTSIREAPVAARGNRTVLIATLAVASAAAIAVAVILLMRGDGERARTPVAQRDPKGITFEPIVEPSAPPPDAAPPAPDAPEPADAVEIVDPKGAGSGSAKRIRPRPDGTKTNTPSPKPDDGLTREEVAAKFSATSRQYEAFKAKNGMRLDAEWNELTSFIQFKMTADNLDDAVRRIDAFRSKLRE
jgi:serine/threonine protein kinase